MEEQRPKCPICSQQLKNIEKINNRGAYEYDCTTCGRYSITEEAASDLPIIESFNTKKHILSGLIREANRNGREIEITNRNIQQLIDSASLPDGPLEAIDRILLYIYENLKDAASFVELKPTDYPIAYSKNKEEFLFFRNQAIELGYLIKKPQHSFQLSLKGWERVNELRRKRPESRQAFTAMWFTDDMKEVWEEGIKPALEATGYIPIKMDQIEHNDRIDDRIYAEIYKSGLLVADLTGNRGGVYFEAGYALGLGIPVIWTCHKDHMKDIHFDTRQYNYIIWESPEELKENLIIRIEASLPHRPVES